ncbi:MAG: trimethylamine methyltransferase family protein [bacterium]
MLNERAYRSNTNPHAPLSDPELQKITDAIFQLLRETGVKFDPVPRVMDTLSDAGCEVSAQAIVKFPTELVRSCMDSVARSARVWNRPGNDSIELSLPHALFATNLSAPNVVDIDTGERRPCTSEDLAMISRVADALPDIDLLLVWLKASEIDRFAAIAGSSTKPWEAVFEDPLALAAAIEMAAAIRGGLAQLKEKPYFITAVSGMPLWYTKNDLEQLLMVVENGLPLAVGTATIGGANAPITIAGNVVHCFASDLAGLVLSQLLNKGSFCMVGSTVGFMDPTTGNLGSLNEFTLAEMVKCQLGRHLGLPVSFANAGINAGKEFNQEAVLGITVTMMASIFSQPTCSSYAGAVDALQAYSLHALLLCHELIGTARRMWKGVKVDEETLALDVTHKVGPGGDFLGEMHTAVHCRKEISPIKYFASRTFESWDQEGRKDLKDVIDRDLRNILATHKPEPLPASVQEQMNAVLQRYARV